MASTWELLEDASEMLQLKSASRKWTLPAVTHPPQGTTGPPDVPSFGVQEASVVCNPRSVTT